MTKYVAPGVITRHSNQASGAAPALRPSCRTRLVCLSGDRLAERQRLRPECGSLNRENWCARRDCCGACGPFASLNARLALNGDQIACGDLSNSLVVCRVFELKLPRGETTHTRFLNHRILVRPERFELPASWFVARRSIQLSYGRARGANITTPSRECHSKRFGSW